ncbi:hypothetical protein P8917_01205 [Bacillus atrophaeus]|uniref:hypothetical protein n=1 Tax=Bacillus atrophaeus TaxID=1452 RepID=UPI00227E998A|nr:hypothetical protein [Bacillus atrophaeus]MCY8813621.1 hypothetical protein [Bacillus atrophaeus]MCY8820306.1 hypothetical protein [Bacillus atrophaeus]MCY8828570.1 hypothetical protein [Bacillus atrophaeus]MCY8832657.1 hypothetical protein [Bacillus atrophaeus]MEC0749809.1 hypothetical protein [Bacillus atrophaeus]
MSLFKNLFKNRTKSKQTKKTKAKKHKNLISKLDNFSETYKRDFGLEIMHLGGFPKIKANKNIRITKAGAGRLKINGYPVKVIHIEWNEKGKRSVGKAATGAVVAGVATGGFGAIVGAAVGGRNKDNSTCVMIVEYTNVNYTVYLRGNQKKYNELVYLMS